MMDESKARFLHGQSLLYMVVFILAGHLMVDSVSGGTWWSLGLTNCGLRYLENNGNNSCPNCAVLAKTSVLTSNQKASCLEEPAIIPSISRGARYAIIDCQRRFVNSRWNCSTLYGDYVFGKFVSQNYTRETAVLTSYFIAGAIWAISTDCHDQRLSGCTCVGSGQNNIDGNLILNTCEANLDYAREYLQNFVINAISNNTLRGNVERHNIRIGEESIAGRETICRCHGISGTCSVQTCYLRALRVEEIGDVLYQKYGGAQQVSQMDEVSNDEMSSTLVYTDNSPDFCVRNDTRGITGVTHRKCDTNSNAPNACSTICCHFGYFTTSTVVPVKECEFVWCCKIVCSIVRNETVIEHWCNAPNNKQ